MTTRTCWAVGLWWTALAISAVALFVNQVLWHGAGIGPGPAMGVAALIVQSVMLVLVARGNVVARGLTLLFLLLSTLPLGIVPRLVAERSWWEAGYTLVVFVLKGVGTALLFASPLVRATQEPPA